jgi:acylphosphatase
LNLTGWVANLPDGRVEVVARGTREHVQALEEAISNGPAMANVETVEKSDIPHQAVRANVFEIK